MLDKHVEDPVGYSGRVGERLRAIRRQKRLSLQEVETRSQQEFRASVLGAYERGERAISVPRLQRLARCYAVPVEQLLPPDAGDDVRVDPEPRSAGPSPNAVTIDLTRLRELDDGGPVGQPPGAGPDAEPRASMLVRYLESIQVQRQDFNGRVLTVRGDDLRAIACMLETTIDQAVACLDRLGLRLSR